MRSESLLLFNDHVWLPHQRKHFPRYWPFVGGGHQHRWSPLTKASDAELWCFLGSLRRWWFETPSRSLWRHCNAYKNVWGDCIIIAIDCSCRVWHRGTTTCLRCVGPPFLEISFKRQLVCKFAILYAIHNSMNCNNISITCFSIGSDINRFAFRDNQVGNLEKHSAHQPCRVLSMINVWHGTELISANFAKRIYLEFVCPAASKLITPLGSTP